MTEESTNQLAPLDAVPLEDAPALELAVMELPARQRSWLYALEKEHFVVSRARRRLGRRAPSYSTIAIWQQTPAYTHAANLAKKVALQRAGIEAASVLLRINELAESGREVVTTTDANGNTDSAPRDAASASANLKLLAQVLGVTESEATPAARTGPGLVIQFIHAEPVKGVTIEQSADAEIIPKVHP